MSTDSTGPKKPRRRLATSEKYELYLQVLRCF